LGLSSELKPIHRISFDNDESQDLPPAPQQSVVCSLPDGHTFPFWSVVDCCVSVRIIRMGIDIVNVDAGMPRDGRGFEIVACWRQTQQKRGGILKVA
jgi:hypothetical protein